MNKGFSPEDKSPWEPRTLIKYALLQIPALGLLAAGFLLLQTWLEFSTHYVWLGLGLWAAKDIALYPLVWRAYVHFAPTPAMNMVGKIGIAKEQLAPRGYLEIQGELWRGRLFNDQESLDKGERVQIVSVEGLELVVRKYIEEPPR